MAGGKYLLLTARQALEDEGFVPMPASCSGKKGPMPGSFLLFAGACLTKEAVCLVP